MLYTSRDSTKFAASGHHPLSFGTDEHTLVLPAMIIGEICELAGYRVGQRGDYVGLEHGIAMVNLVHAFRSIQDHVETVNTLLSWEKLARRVMRRSPTYQPTGESTQDAFFMTYFEGQVERITDEIRSVNALDRFASRVWRVLTLGRGCKWLPAAIPLVTVYAFVVWISRPIWNRLGYPSVSTLEKYAELMRDATDRRLCTATDGLVGLAPPNSVPGDKVALLLGGRVPVVLRQDADGYRLVGEAYVHGAMYGKMMDAKKLALIKIR
ncbi:hypothetical protein O1611_g5460 [Lasiodiplodia mahajangana]|uniref:Uncharacterized protein n=1 Tax=Lasiodiplodia mahajangana TaxID=1108764 RepID=A0ACC2JL41_9PEZI|nr:hypothetical protein O1611_g5460 [Lasiodiplodia mahajangana]